MAVRLVVKPEVWWPVEAKIPQDNGRAVVQKIDVKFEILDNDERENVVNGQGRDLLERVVVGLREVKKNADDPDKPLQDSDGRELALDEAKAILLKLDYYRVAIFAGYGQASTGQGRVKNS